MSELDDAQGAPAGENKWYDDAEGIRARLRRAGLAGLHELVAARREAGERKETLRLWIVCGVIWLDEQGHALYTTENAPRDNPVLAHAEVLSREELAVHDVPVTMVPATIPWPTSECEWCGRGWTLRTVHDIDARNARMMHARCLRLKTDQETLHRLRAIAERAEIPTLTARAVPNEYTDSWWSGPWLLLVTRRGQIRFGRRKNVFHIDWKDSTIEVPSAVFESEQVTKEAQLIHAWSDDKAVEYLRKVWSCVEA